MHQLLLNLLVRRHYFRFGNFHDSWGYNRQKTLDENKDNFTCISRIQRKTYVLVYDRNHYFGLRPKLKLKPRLDNIFDWYRNRYWYLNWTLVLVPDTEFWFWLNTSMFHCHLLFSDRNSWRILLLVCTANISTAPSEFFYCVSIPV